MSESMVDRVSEILRGRMSGNDCLRDACRRAPCECADDLARAAIEAIQAITREEAINLIWDFEDAVIDCERNSYGRQRREMREMARDKLLAAMTAPETPSPREPT